MSNADIRAVLETHARIPVAVESLSDEANLFTAGMTSLASVEVILALEERFGIEFPDQMMHRKTFASVSAIAEAIARLKAVA
ncbi:MAG TPA: acyl carrier protein [Dongiaceae bacterium]|jgi:acyl carrier protein|nr:acyl carrier protein [Dongiaceae bacterium]